MPVIDASVYVALMNPNEAEHASCWAWFENAKGVQEEIAAPVILLAETAAALSRGVGDPDLALRAVQLARNTSLIELTPVTLPLAERAASIAAQHRIRGCDAVYVALAEQLDTPLVTLDPQQLERAVAIVRAHRP